MKSKFIKGLIVAAVGSARAGRCRLGGRSRRFRLLERHAEWRICVWSYHLFADPVAGVVAGVKFFDGKGHLTQRDYRGGSVPAQFAPPRQEKGTYTVNPDCTGSMAIDLNAPVPTGSTGMINILFVISDGGRHIHEVVSKFIPPGLRTPARLQTSADDWKVASERDH